VPAAPAARALLAAAAMPVAAPSANPSGTVSPTEASHVAESLGDRVAIVLDAGPTEGGIESTILAVLPGEPLRLLRPGLVSREDAAEAAGEEIVDADIGPVTAPGQLPRHYAPKARLRLNAARPDPGEAFIAFGPPPPGTTPFRNLSPGGDLREAAASLFATLRALDAAAHARAAVMPVPDQGLGEAINDRLRRAATPEDGE
jgi:L-threonylcarbamoyladenylate synthase